MLNLNERLKTARGYARRYQKDLAKQLKKSVGAICNYEKGINEPSIGELETIAKFCEVSAVWLVLGQGDMLQKDQVIQDPETLSSLEAAKQERAVIQEMQFEDAALEMQTTALQKLEQHVRTYGKRNGRRHWQWRDVVIVGEVLFEVDVTSDEEPEPLTESRASELLEALK